MKEEIWGPASPILIAWERADRASNDHIVRQLSAHLYGRRCIILPYRTPQYVLRRRAMYGGRKGRAAIRRLRALGARPLNFDELGSDT